MLKQLGRILHNTRYKSFLMQSLLPLAIVMHAPPAIAALLAEINTSHGQIVAELYPDRAPKTVANFVQYAKDNFYQGTIFHRVISNFMVQGGGLDKNLSEKPTRPPIRNEADNGLTNTLGTLAMARTNDPHSATAQFFINVNNNAFLNHTTPSDQGWGYTVFGRVTKGMDVVMKISRLPTDGGDVPYQMVTIESVRILDSAKPEPAK